MKSKSVSDLLWILAHFGSHISDSPYLLEHIVEERFEVLFVYRLHGLLFDGLYRGYFWTEVVVVMVWGYPISTCEIALNWVLSTQTRGNKNFCP